jgi:PAS domain S-box-containing protein
VLAALIATLPLVALVAYAAIDRYEADRARADTRATTRSQLYSALLEGTGGTPSQATVRRLVRLAPMVSGGVLDLLDPSGRVVASSGTGRELPPPTDPAVSAALARPNGTFDIRGPDGEVRVWGFAPVPAARAIVAYGVDGNVVYGASRRALWRDLGLAVAAVLAAVAVAMLIAGRATAPIRRLAAQVGGEGGSAGDIAAIEHGLEELSVELRRSEASAVQLAAIVESSADAIVGVALDGTVVSWNAGAESLYGYAAAEIVGASVARLVPTERLEEVPVILGEIAHGKGFELLETERVTRDGRRLYVSLAVSPIHGADGLVVGASEISRDVTERRRAEEEVRRLNEELEERVQLRTAQLEAANRELEAFSYSVSHDLRAPLRAIDGFSREVIDAHADGLDPEGRRYLELVSRNTRDMGLLIDGLLAFSRLGQQPLDKRRVDVSALVRDVVAGLAAEYDGRTKQIEVGELPGTFADRTLLRQVFANLLSNAIKFTRDVPEPLIEVEAEGSSGVGLPPVYVVRDNGVGFDMRHADRLFTAFQRLHGADAFEGSGIGLALVARIVTRHGGRIWAESAPGAGAAFHFTLENGFD